MVGFLKQSSSFETKCEQRNLVRNHSELKNLQTVWAQEHKPESLLDQLKLRLRSVVQVMLENFSKI